MMKKLFILSISILMSFSSFAFEGVIEQTFTDVNTKEQKTIIWYIQNDNVRFDVITAEETVSIIPDFSSLSLNIYGNKADENGNFYYLNSSIADAKVNAPKLRVLEQNDSEYNGKEAKEIKLMSQDGLLVVQYINSIEVNMKNLLTVFAESKEIQAISLVGDIGFPVSSVIMTNDEAIYTLTTKSITEKSLAPSNFSVPSNYKLFDPSTLGK